MSSAACWNILGATNILEETSSVVVSLDTGRGGGSGGVDA